MRVLFGANIFISYFLQSDKEETIPAIIHAGFEGAYTFVLPSDVLSEFHNKLAEKPYLVSRISREEAERFVLLLSRVAATIPPIKEPMPDVSRDTKDDYLIAYATVGACDYLVTGDDDLLVLRHIGQLKIVNPAEFLRILHP